MPNRLKVGFFIGTEPHGQFSDPILEVDVERYPANNRDRRALDILAEEARSLRRSPYRRISRHRLPLQADASALQDC